MPLVAGIDSSTQSTKVVVHDLGSGERVAAASAPHTAVTPPVSEQDPEVWWRAFEMAWQRCGAPAVAAISIAGQQHGMVALDTDDVPVHPAKLWNDTESAPDAGWLLGQELAGGQGRPTRGADAWASAVGSVPLAAFTVTKLSWLHRTHADAWGRMARVMLPHDWMTHRLTGRFTTDRGDASGTGYWSPAEAEYRWDILSVVDVERDWSAAVPEVLAPLDVAGEWGGVVVGVGTGDNMASALGLGLRPGDVAISVGTSGTVFTVSENPTFDVSGAVAGFADATGRFLPLVCTSNAAKVIDAIGRLLAVDHDEFDDLAIAAEPGGPVLLPYFDGERTPDRPDATGVLSRLRSDVTRAQLARAAVDGVACGLLDGLDELRRHAPCDGRLMLTGGAARSAAMRGVVAGLVDRPLVVADIDEAVATGAAVQAAATLEQVDAAVIQDRWSLGGGIDVDPLSATPGLRERYAALRDSTG